MEKKGLLIIAVLAVLYWWTKSPTFVNDETQIELKYHIMYTDGGSSGDDLPTFIALHGNGDTYDNFYQYTLEDMPFAARIVLVEAPNKYWPYDLPNLEKYSIAMADLSAFIQDKFSLVKKPLLYGFSGGAVMAYFSALSHCDSYSLIVPISGKLEKQMLSHKITMNNDCHVLAFHGKSDGVISFSAGQFAIKTLMKHSNNVDFIGFDGGHQGVFEQKTMILAKVKEAL
jgi:predicted esterase